MIVMYVKETRNNVVNFFLNIEENIKVEVRTGMTLSHCNDFIDDFIDIMLGNNYSFLDVRDDTNIIDIFKLYEENEDLYIVKSEKEFNRYHFHRDTVTIGTYPTYEDMLDKLDILVRIFKDW